MPWWRPGGYDASGALGDAGRGAAPPGEAARSGHGRRTCGRTARCPGTASFLGRLPLWRALEVGGRQVQVGERQGTVEIWSGDERIAVHPRAQQPKQRFILPGQWAGLPRGDNRPRKDQWRCRYRGRGGTALAGRVRAGGGRCGMIALEQVVSTWKPWASSRPSKSWTTPWTPRPTGSCPIRRCWPNCIGVEVAARRERYLTTRTGWPICLSSVPSSNSTSPSSPPSTSGWSRNCPTWFVAEATSSS